MDSLFQYFFLYLKLIHVKKSTFWPVRVRDGAKNKNGASCTVGGDDKKINIYDNRLEIPKWPVMVGVAAGGAMGYMLPRVRRVVGVSLVLAYYKKSV